MKNIDKKIKRLAEKYYYGNYKLTAKQRTILENSKYSKLLGPDRDYHEFDKILENFETSSNIESGSVSDQPVARKTKFHMFQTKLADLKDLIDEVEDNFFLGLENFGLDRYKRIDVNQLRSFIANYAKQHISDGGLLAELKNVISKQTPWSIMYNLRMLLTR
jgi:hypothetical protein